MKKKDLVNSDNSLISLILYMPVVRWKVLCRAVRYYYFFFFETLFFYYFFVFLPLLLRGLYFNDQISVLCKILTNFPTWHLAFVL